MNIQKRLNILILILAAFFLTLTCRQERIEWKGVVEKADGVIIVKNPNEPLYQEDIFVLNEELQIHGGDIDQEEEMFENIVSFAVDDNQNIYALDSKAANIKVFDGQGRLIRIVGRRGQGPGEMVRPLDIQIFSRKELMVQDVGQFCLLFYTPEGDYLRKIPTLEMPNFGRPRVDSSGFIIAGHLIYGNVTKTYVKKFDSLLKPVFTVASLSVVSRPPSANSSGIFDFFELERGTNMVWNITREDRILWGDFTRYEIHVYSPEGKLEKKIFKDQKPVEITEDTKEKLVDEMGQGLPPIQGATVEFPKYFPAFIRFSSDEEGRIFVQTYEKTADGKKDNYDVFDSEGRYLARIPLEHRLQIWKDNRLYTLEDNEDGCQIIKRYRVDWKLR